jgi:hypothetical protein
VLDADGGSVPWRFHFSRPPGTAMGGLRWKWAFGRMSLSELDGTLSGVAAGRHTLRVHAGPGDPHELVVEVPESGEVVREVQLDGR